MPIALSLCTNKMSKDKWDTQATKIDKSKQRPQRGDLISDNHKRLVSITV